MNAAGRRTPGLTRRTFLVHSSWLAAGLTVTFSCSRLLPALPTRALPEREDGDAWLQVLPDGRVRFLCPRSEMGQGISTGLTQIVAEELDLRRDEIECVLPDTDRIPPALMTVGSWSMLRFAEPTARAAARLREALRARAAGRLGVPAEELVQRGAGFETGDGRRVAYGQLVGEEPELVDEEDGPLALHSFDPTRERVAVGRDWAPVDVRDIVTGRDTYSRDVVLPGMLYGTVVKPPRAGAELRAFDEQAVRGDPSVVDVVVDRRRHLVGIVADLPFALASAVERLDARWEGGDAFDQDELDRRLDVDAALEGGALEHEPIEHGDLARAQGEARALLDARYASPMTAHAAMEPRAAVARVQPEGVEVWSASQDPWLMRELVARAVERSPADVRIHNHRLGGGFGGRTLCHATVEAAWLSGAVGRPVRVQWSREEELAHNSVGPQFSHRIRAGVDADGRISHWDHAMVSCPIMFSSAFLSESLYWLLDFPSDPGTMRNAEPAYALPAHRLRFSDVRIPIVTGAWRGLGAAPNAFAVESAMDELAGLAGADPLAFRLRHLPEEETRLRTLLERVRALSGWDEATPPNVGRGVACAIYKGEARVAVVAEVEGHAREPGYRIRRVSCAHDCGAVVSPSQVRAQIEGNVAWGCSMALHERMTAAGGAPAAGNFDAYPVLRMSEMPEVEIELVEPPGVAPCGAGEAALVPTPAAIANALFAATGQRARTLPLRPSA